MFADSAPTVILWGGYEDESRLVEEGAGAACGHSDPPGAVETGLRPGPSYPAAPHSVP